MREYAYNREAAVQYAKQWALSRNPRYYDFDKLGGDCTNFASQCVYAGAGVMNYTPVFGWYYKNADNRSASFTGTEYFYNFMIGNVKGVGPFMEEVDLSGLLIGDVLQLRFENKAEFSHTPVVVSIKDPPTPANILIAAHTKDSLMRPLSTYEYANLRALHVLGVRNWT